MVGFPWYPVVYTKNRKGSQSDRDTTAVLVNNYVVALGRRAKFGKRGGGGAGNGMSSRVYLHECIQLFLFCFALLLFLDNKSW